MIDSKLPAGCEEAARCTSQLDDLLTATYALADDFLPKRRGPGRPPRITDAELITLAIAQVFMASPAPRSLDGRSQSRVLSPRSQGRAAPIRIARARAPVDRIGLLDLQGTARPRAPRRPALPGPVRPGRAAAPRPRRRAPA